MPDIMTCAKAANTTHTAANTAARTVREHHPAVMRHILTSGYRPTCPRTEFTPAHHSTTPLRSSTRRNTGSGREARLASWPALLLGGIVVAPARYTPAAKRGVRKSRPDGCPGPL
ncbi:hypothetical protein HEK131_29850 [Streptomyces seoulensis]|nr:hypothetical protein HEK131_29850 [Streptomyces seoulensis]